MKHILLLVLLALSLVACTTNEPTTTDNTQDSTENINTETTTSTETTEEDVFFTASVTGDITREFQDIATLTCTDGNGTNIPRHQILTMNDDDTRSTIAVSMPALSEPGTYPLEGQTVENYGTAFAIEVFFDRSIGFDVVEDGTITLDEIAKGPGEPVKGSLQATMTTDDGEQSIMLTANFDFVSITTEDMEALNYEYSFLYCAQE